MSIFEFGFSGDDDDDDGALPPQLRGVIERMKLHSQKVDKAKEAARRMRGQVEAEVLTPMVDAMRNDHNMSTHDMMDAAAAWHDITRLIEERSRSLSWWAHAYVADSIRRYAELQANMARELGSTYEKMDPGSTTEIGDLELPPSVNPADAG